MTGVHLPAEIVSVTSHEVRAMIDRSGKTSSASSNTDLLLLSINTFQKDLSDSSPLIRSMSLRVLTSIRLPVIQGRFMSPHVKGCFAHSVTGFAGILMIGLKKLAIDRNPWVRKTVALGLPKVYE